MIHDLKTWPGPFAAVRAGLKLHEIRRADRPFAEGDMLHLREWDPATEQYTGAEVRVHVTHVTAAGEWGLPPDLCVMSIAIHAPTVGRVCPCGWLFNAPWNRESPLCYRCELRLNL